MVYTITGTGLTIEDVERVARQNEVVKLCPKAAERIARVRKVLDTKLAAGETIYGVNTGIGEFSETKLKDEDVVEFQRMLVYNHSAGINGPMPIEPVRAAMLGRINVHAHGNSAVRLCITETLVEMLNKGVTPFVCEMGSVGACGDLAPMSQIALVLLGEGEAYYKGELLSGGEAMKRAGIPCPGLGARDGLAVINGCNVLTAMSALWLCDAFKMLRTAEITAAMSMEALNSNLGPLDERIHLVRGFHGAIETAVSLRTILAGGSLMNKKKKVRCQDAYTLRSSPQVIGAAHDAFVFARSQVEIELNGVGDNPVFFAETDQQVSGANFQGSPISVPMDMAGYSLCMVCVMSERRMNRLNNPALSAGLPPFLATNPGMMSGMMVSQYTADSQIVAQRILSAPASVQSIPAAADQEDFVSMGMNTAIKNNQILDHAAGIIGIEMMAASQALDLRRKLDDNKYDYGVGVQVALDEVRKHVKFLDIDRPLHYDHNKMKALLKSFDVLKAVEKAVGPLPQPHGRKPEAIEAAPQQISAAIERGRARSRSRSRSRELSPVKAFMMMLNVGSYH